MDKDRVGAQRLFELAAATQLRIRKAVEAALRALGLTYAQYGALQALDAKEGLSQSELALALETDATTAMVLRHSLEKKGLIERAGDPSDGRVKRIALTTAGRSAFAAARPAVEAVYAAADGLVTDQEGRKAAAVLERLASFAGEAALAASPKGAAPAEGARRRGRPRKNPVESALAEPKHRGRPRKDEASAAKAAGRPAKRGRKIASEAQAEALSAEESAAGKAVPKAAAKAGAKAPKTAAKKGAKARDKAAKPAAKPRKAKNS
jgi:MarR family transcriptional regulator for hemolysin